MLKFEFFEKISHLWKSGTLIFIYNKKNHMSTQFCHSLTLKWNYLEMYVHFFIKMAKMGQIWHYLWFHTHSRAVDGNPVISVIHEHLCDKKLAFYKISVIFLLKNLENGQNNEFTHKFELVAKKGNHNEQNGIHQSIFFCHSWTHIHAKKNRWKKIKIIAPKYWGSILGFNIGVQY